MTTNKAAPPRLEGGASAPEVNNGAHPKATRGLAPPLEKRLRAAADRARAATLERNELIAEASEAGASLREIAAATGLHFTSVRKILRG